MNRQILRNLESLEKKIYQAANLLKELRSTNNILEEKSKQLKEELEEKKRLTAEISYLQQYKNKTERLLEKYRADRKQIRSEVNHMLEELGEIGV
ncbi:hypothetical protein CEE39_06735 [bacterium (candidate division B38) B3_B38]|nr:MAG: hypothetical protein CEE39_06735 [bacterium (candidate division B38) B3_B38]